MKMSQLSATSGIPVATIKMYLREGLLPAGERLGTNQAKYGEAHLRRLKVIQALMRIGGLSLAAAKSVLDAIDSDLELPHTFRIAQEAATNRVDRSVLTDDDFAKADEIMSGWHTSPDSVGRASVASVVRAFEEAELPTGAEWYGSYVKAALIVAEADLDAVELRATREAKAETVVIGTVLGDALFAALSRAAQQHISVQRYHFGPPEPMITAPNAKEAP